MKLDPTVATAVEQLTALVKTRLRVFVEEHKQVNAQLRIQEQEMSKTRRKSTDLWFEAQKMFDGLKQFAVGSATGATDPEIQKLMKILDDQEKEPRQYVPDIKR